MQYYVLNHNAFDALIILLYSTIFVINMAYILLHCVKGIAEHIQVIASKAMEKAICKYCE